MFSVYIEKYWYSKHPVRWFLWPISLFYQLFMHLRRKIYQNFIERKSNLPIIVVGNLTVGGVGKTPLVIALVNKLKEQGFKPGIVSRGYGSWIKQFPYEVLPSDSASLVGDEPFLIAQKTNSPVVISPNRNKAVKYLEEHSNCDIVVSDDGLQHYRMKRDIEICVIDGTRGLGNGLCLPAGPLREPKSRLNKADFLVANAGNWDGAYAMTLKATNLINLSSNQPYDFHSWPNSIAAIAGIGNPQRFFATLRDYGCQEFSTYIYADHYKFKKTDFKFNEKVIFMTEKDAVKCKNFATDNMYYLPVVAELTQNFWDNFFKSLDSIYKSHMYKYKQK